MARVPDIHEVCHILAVVSLVGILVIIIIEGPPININPTELKAQLFVAFVASILSMGVALASIYYKDYLDNRPPLEFKVDLEQRETDKNVKFVFCYKNNIDSIIKIESYHISITKEGIDKPILYPSCPHFSAELIYPWKGWQERPFEWTLPKTYNIEAQGTYGIVATIYYRYKNKDGRLFYAITKKINVQKQQPGNSEL